jgi:hypothetical protein
MTTQSRTEERTAGTEATSRTSALDWAVFGCLAAGAVGIMKALNMEKASDVLICLVGSVLAFGTVFYMHVRKD